VNTHTHTHTHIFERVITIQSSVCASVCVCSVIFNIIYTHGAQGETNECEFLSAFPFWGSYDIYYVHD